MPDGPLLSVQALQRHFVTARSRGRSARTVRAVDGVDFDLQRGETLGIVGESGSGKSTLARVLVGLLAPTGGAMSFDGQPLDWQARHSRALRRDIQMIFQDPMGSLDPRWRVRDIVGEPLDVFGVGTRDERAAAAAEVLSRVGLDRSHWDKVPAQLSGGQRQRVGIARAIILRPALVVCDEPVSALDVSIRGQILDLLAELGRDLSLAYIYISHDMGTVRKIADRVLTMYLGQVVEAAPALSFFETPHHPYAQALVSAVPVADPDLEARRRRFVLGGEPADPGQVPTGCRFHPRCPLAQQVCIDETPDLREVAPGRFARCHFAPEARLDERAA